VPAAVEKVNPSPCTYVWPGRVARAVLRSPTVGRGVTVSWKDTASPTVLDMGDTTSAMFSCPVVVEIL
jgi:hypothetical protein